MHPRQVCRRLLAVLALTGLVAAGAVIGSPAAGAASAANRNYVRSLYGDLLNRTNTTSNQTGIDYWANRLATHSRLSVVTGIQHSTNEYFGKIVDISYAIYLERKPDPRTRAFLANGLRTRSLSFNDVTARLVGSHEYFVLAGATNARFVDRAHADILGFPPSSSARSHLIGVAETQGRAKVAVLLATSHRARADFVRFQYRSFLGRPVTAAALEYRIDQLSNGLRREDFDALLVSSNEYYGKNS